jgi:hypothetical protein
MLEGRAPWEYAALLAATPWLRKLPRGTATRCWSLPGLGANDLTTSAAAGPADLGHATQPWGQGFNFGPRAGVLEQIKADLQALHRRHHRKVSLLGWSLRHLCPRAGQGMPELARCVVTLGTPFTGHPRATNAWRFFELVSGHASNDPALMRPSAALPPVPTTSIFSKTDGVSPGAAASTSRARWWRTSRCMPATSAWASTPWPVRPADRLPQPEGAWQPFEPKGARRWFYKTPTQPA